LLIEEDINLDIDSLVSPDDVSEKTPTHNLRSSGMKTAKAARKSTTKGLCSSSTTNVYNLLQNMKKLNKQPEITLSKHSKLVKKANRFMMESKILKATRRYKRENPDRVGGEKRLRKLVSKQLIERT
jgi:hypothetical protein